MFSIRDEAGSLLKVLQLLARNKINLTKIQSRPLRDRPWEYLFYVDLEGHIEDSSVKKSIDSLIKTCLFLKLLGSYPRKA
jgi:chorismate mutase/prephenate dehydratase